jgi:hypothetical protein
MFLRPLLRPSRRAPAVASSQPFQRCYSHKHRSKPPFQTVQSCPSPTCACGPMPEMPEGLPIDHSKPLNGSMAGYAEQILICTGKSDWPSKIEEADSGDNLAADIKELVGRGGIYSDVCLHLSLFPTQDPQTSLILNPKSKSKSKSKSD